MTEECKPTASDLSAEIMSAERPARSNFEERPPAASAMDPVGLLLYPWLRRHRRKLLPLILVATGALVALALMTR